ncbi:delta-lactam-biosynthetic de-N-acetylase [Lederbergia citrea]|uniref:Delta-lactam-biosynthetic de-N-acetylase n=1 Tax=Lederbergia citrea TaxID=2833581 RepID=A0A942UXN0_9BACI|nr:delta-lactam-biosynthetic de-N-acetylase [Lederbergia citrea]MBS4205872.1 delta-lactam-biosynthetic de-N-acetylase [Lederbergia citrea]MBS4224679.1 delta-lactam-biosynthetic de-N-acetylase [Lederbergia citrea]
MRKWQIIVPILFLVFFNAIDVHAFSNQPVHWGFTKGKNEKQADAGEKYDALLDKYGAFYKGSADEKVLYLTFDNGYENGYTGKILDVLKKEKVPATFFVTGHYLKSAPDLSKRMVNEGHIIGNHSWTHPDMTQISDEKIKMELAKVKEETKKLTGQKNMQYLRPPRGILSERTLKVARDEGYIHVLWSLAFRDWQTNQQKGWKYAYDNIMAQVHPGSIMLLHTVSSDNAEALEKVIKDLKKRGYTFKSLDDYIIKEKIKNPAIAH